MASTYSWHPGNSVVTPDRNLRFQLLPDESLSSFLVRLSHHYGLTPLALSEFLSPGSRAWSIDTDRLTPRFLVPLSNWSGISLEQLSHTTVRYYENLAGEVRHKQDSVRPWFTTVGVRNRKREAGFSYCPICLAESPLPYLRIYWRFAWHTECIKHSRGLLDCCQQCHEPLKPHLQKPETQSLSVCYFCGFDARNAKAPPINLSASNIQNELDTLLLSGGAMVGKHHLNCSDFFGYVSFWIIFLRRARRVKTGALCQFLSRLPFRLPAVNEFSKGWRFEKLPVSERSLLMQGVSYIIRMELEEIRFQLSDMGFSKQTLMGDQRSVPEILMEVVNDLPDNPKVRSNNINKKDIRATPKYLVARKMKKLIIKFGIRKNALRS